MNKNHFLADFVEPSETHYCPTPAEDSPLPALRTILPLFQRPQLDITAAYGAHSVRETVAALADLQAAGVFLRGNALFLGVVCDVLPQRGKVFVLSELRKETLPAHFFLVQKPHLPRTDKIIISHP